MRIISLLLTLIAVSVFALGCTDTNSSVSQSDSSDAHSEDDGHDHSHDHTPPHGGQLIELGRNHEYHAELVDDHKTESVTIYIMDGHMEPLSINQSTVSIVLTAGGKTETFELLASQPGSASEFKASDENLMEMLETEGAKGKLRVTINDKPFSGSFEHHDHDHEGEDDSHEGHDHG